MKTALIAAAAVATLTGFVAAPASAAEVEIRNTRALAFYAAVGFAEIGRGSFGWPWSGPVALLHRPV